MVQTREERNKVQRDNRFAKWHNRYNNIRARIIHTFDRVQKEFWTSDQLLDYRNKWIFDDVYTKLPGWVKDRLTGVWDTCNDLLWRQLHVTYPHPDTGARMRYDDLPDSVDKSRLGGDTCKMCFWVDGKLHPYT